MADNTRLNFGTGGDLVAADDIGGVKYQRTKLTIGPPGISNGDVHVTNPLPVYAPSGLPLPAGAATQATLAAVATEATLAALLAPRNRATYSAAILGLVPAATPTDVFTILGSATKKVRITKIMISGTQTTAGVINVALVKRSTANTGGTSSNPAAVPHDSADPAATAVVAAYTANPTLGTGLGTMQAHKVLIPAPASVAQAITVLELDDTASKGIVLNGITEQLAINLNGVTLTGGSLDLSVEFTEE